MNWLKSYWKQESIRVITNDVGDNALEAAAKYKNSEIGLLVLQYVIRQWQ